MFNIEIVEKPMNGTPHLTYKAFKYIPTEFLITENTESGTTVYVANFPKNFKMKFRKYHQPASPGFPSGGYTLWNPKQQVIYNCYLDGAMIHPDNKKKTKKKTINKKCDFF